MCELDEFVNSMTLFYIIVPNSQDLVLIFTHNLTHLMNNICWIHRAIFSFVAPFNELESISNFEISLAKKNKKCHTICIGRFIMFETHLTRHYSITKDNRPIMIPLF